MNKYMRVYLRCAGAFNVRLQRQSMQLAVMDDALNYTCKESSPLYIKICVGHDVFFLCAPLKAPRIDKENVRFIFPFALNFSKELLGEINCRKI
jgi:hypothetical protein